MKVAIISDIHEDIERLCEALKKIETYNVDQLVCLGDMTGFGAPYYSYIRTRDANAVIDKVKNFDVVVNGNHDLFDVKMLPSNFLELNIPMEYYSLNRQTRKALVKGKLFAYETELDSLLSEASEQFLGKNKEYCVTQYNQLKVLYSHYVYPDLTGTTTFKVNKYKDLKKHYEFMRDNGCLYSFSGHEHHEGLKLFTKDRIVTIPFNEKYQLEEKPTWISVPALANGTNQNGFVIFDTDKSEIEAIALETPPHVKFGGFK